MAAGFCHTTTVAADDVTLERIGQAWRGNRCRPAGHHATRQLHRPAHSTRGCEARLLGAAPTCTRAMPCREDCARSPRTGRFTNLTAARPAPVCALLGAAAKATLGRRQQLQPHAAASVQGPCCSLRASARHSRTHRHRPIRPTAPAAQAAAAGRAPSRWHPVWPSARAPAPSQLIAGADRGDVGALLSCRVLRPAQAAGGGARRAAGRAAAEWAAARQAEETARPR